jgi:UDP:flavonoid glycosyltransferase YjiC (YdhE family)
MNTEQNALSMNTIPAGTRILFATVPADGHFNPLTGLAAHLKQSGCDVRWYTSKVYEDKIKKLDIPFYGLKKALDIGATHGDIDGIFPERNKLKGQLAKLKFDIINAFILRGPEYFEDIREIHESFPFELMISDITFGAIPFVKEVMDIPVIGVDIFPLPETSKDLPPTGLGMTPSYSFLGKIKQDILRFITNKILFAGPTKLLSKIFAQYGIDSEGAGIFDVMILKSTMVFQSGTPGFEYKRSDMSSNIHFVGPLLPYSKKIAGSSWFNEKLRKYEKVVLVTQGTVEKDIEKIIVPTLEAFKDSDILVIVTTGGSKTKELRRRYPQNNFIIEDFIPFNEVMPYADVYLTNGGYGGVLLSIQNRLPMVVAGIHEGKNEINARIGYFRLGINLKTEKPLPRQIRNAVFTVFTDPVFTENVKKLGDEFNRYDPETLCQKYISRVLKRSARQKAIIKRESDLIY